MKTKKVTLLITGIILGFLIFSVWYTIRKENAEKERQLLDFNKQVENLSCGESISISEMKGWYIISEFRNEIIKGKRDTIILGQSKYAFVGNDMSNKEYERTYLLQTKKESYLKFSIYIMESGPYYGQTFMDVECKCQ